MLKRVLTSGLRVAAGTLLLLVLAATVGIPSGKRGPAASTAATVSAKFLHDSIPPEADHSEGRAACRHQSWPEFATHCSARRRPTARMCPDIRIVQGGAVHTFELP